MFEISREVERVVLVHINFKNSNAYEDITEFRHLAQAAGVLPTTVIIGSRQTPEAKYFVGIGKLQEIQQAIAHYQANLVIFNHTLTPSQERNLEQTLECRVLDRVGLILDIFAQRARTFAGKLQVELAQLQYLSSRLIRGWTHLERQKGGIGLRGPGETQLETDRRLLSERIKTINKRLVKLCYQRDLSRQARRKAALPTVSIVGYTNAGKSSLFNALTQADVFTANQLFATLDPTLRRINLVGSGPAILADTVGFIRHLPHSLIDAFQATLEETCQAHLLLHVIDIANAHWRDNVREVDKVLADIGAADIVQLQVYNKIDQLEGVKPQVKRNQAGEITQVWISALKAQGLELLKAAISHRLYGDPIFREVCLTPKQGKLRAELYQLKAVQQESIDKRGNWLLSVRIAKSDFIRLFMKQTTPMLS